MSCKESVREGLPLLDIVVNYSLCVWSKIKNKSLFFKFNLILAFTQKYNLKVILLNMKTSKTFQSDAIVPRTMGDIFFLFVFLHFWEYFWNLFKVAWCPKFEFSLTLNSVLLFLCGSAVSSPGKCPGCDQVSRDHLPVLDASSQRSSQRKSAGLSSHLLGQPSWWRY